MQHLRAFAAGDAARLVDHARQSKSGHRRSSDAGRLPRDGNDATVTTAALGGIGSLFELNVAMPVMIDAFLETVKLLLERFQCVMVAKTIDCLEVNEERAAI